MIPEIEDLLRSPEAAIRYKASVKLLGAPADSTEALGLRAQIPGSPAALTLLSEQGSDGKIPLHPYQKWRGAHWVLACLADLDYPPGDEALRPLLEQTYAWLLGKAHTANIPTIQGRVRRCASQEGNALFASLALGLADDRSEELAERLMRWQWLDGGWNCDRRPEAVHSSYNESLIPMRALALYYRLSGAPRAAQTVERAADLFLKRQLFRRQSDGSPIHASFLELHYPSYWHYDVLTALRVMAESGYLADPRCRPALDWLESQRLPGGGFPAQAKFYSLSAKTQSGRSLVDWGGISLKKPNPFVTVQSLAVLKAAGRGSA